MGGFIRMKSSSDILSKLMKGALRLKDPIGTHAAI